MYFIESDMYFRFGPEWVVRQYDTHRYFKGWSGKGLKGVDFIGILHQKTLVFFEIKNFNLRPSGRGGHTLELVRQNPNLLAETFIRKITDTFTAIDAVGKYWQRHWWRRMAGGLVRYLSARKYDAAFWQKVTELAAKPSECVAVLWLESQAFDYNYRKQLSSTLAEALSLHCKEVIVADAGSNPFSNTMQTNISDSQS